MSKKEKSSSAQKSGALAKGMFETATEIVQMGELQRSGTCSTGCRKSFDEGNFEEVAVYSGPLSGHKYQFLRDFYSFQDDSAEFIDRKITPQLAVLAAAFSENALLDSPVWPCRLFRRFGIAILQASLFSFLMIRIN